MYLRAAKSEAHAHVQKEENITQAQDVTLTVRFPPPPPLPPGGVRPLIGVPHVLTHTRLVPRSTRGPVVVWWVSRLAAEEEAVP